jgi:zinc protease
MKLNYLAKSLFLLCFSGLLCFEGWSSYQKNLAPPLFVYDGEPISSQRTLPTLSEPSEKGKIVSQENIPAINARSYLLSNGMKVILKSTDYKNDELSFELHAPGGFSHLPEEAHPSAYLSKYYLGDSRHGVLTQSSLTRFLCSREIEIDVDMMPSKRRVTGNLSPNEIESLLHWMYALFTANEYNSHSFEHALEHLTHAIESEASLPASDKRHLTLPLNAFGPLATRPLTVEDMQNIKPKDAEDYLNSAFSDPSAFTLIITGHVDIEKFESMIAKYLASIPAHQSNIHPTKTVVPKQFQYQTTTYTKTETTSSVITFPLTFPYDLNTIENVKMICRLLELSIQQMAKDRNIELLSTKSFYNIPLDPRQQPFQIFLKVKSNHADHKKLLRGTFDTLITMAKDGPDPQLYDKTTRLMTHNRQFLSYENAFWTHMISEELSYGIKHSDLGKPTPELKYHFVHKLFAQSFNDMNQEIMEGRLEQAEL